MKSGFILFLLLILPAVITQAQSNSPDDQVEIKPRKLPPSKPATQPQNQGESSSRDSQINNGAPRGKPSETGDVQELTPWDPHKAAKDVEVGEYYLKRKNYRAALDRFTEALLYKPRDAEATLRLAQTQEKLDLYPQAYQNYHNYLEWLPNGPLSKEAQEGLKRVAVHVESGQQEPSSEFKQALQDGEEYLARNDFEEAYTRFARAVKLAPNDPLANLRLAQSLQALQRLDEARIYYRKCLDLQPGDHYAGEARKAIARINDILGK